MAYELRKKVTAKTNSGFIYEGVKGEVIGSRIRHHDDLVEYQVMFPQRKFSDNDINIGLDAPDNICWLLESELAPA